MIVLSCEIVTPVTSSRKYLPLQDNLLLYNHARLMSQDNHSKDYLVSIMFSHYDRNNNGNLEPTELGEVAFKLHRDEQHHHSLPLAVLL